MPSLISSSLIKILKSRIFGVLRRSETALFLIDIGRSGHKFKAENELYQLLLSDCKLVLTRARNHSCEIAIFGVMGIYPRFFDILRKCKKRLSKASKPARRHQNRLKPLNYGQTHGFRDFSVFQKIHYFLRFWSSFLAQLLPLLACKIPGRQQCQKINFDISLWKTSFRGIFRRQIRIKHLIFSQNHVLQFFS